VILLPPHRRYVLHSDRDVKAVEAVVRSSFAHRFRPQAGVDLGKRSVVTGVVVRHRVSAHPLPQDANGLHDAVSLGISGKVEAAHVGTSVRVKVGANPLVLVLVPALILLTMFTGIIALWSGNLMLSVATIVGILVVLGLAIIISLVNEWGAEMEVTDEWIKSLSVDLDSAAAVE
jgi:hypothetical protein